MLHRFFLSCNLHTFLLYTLQSISICTPHYYQVLVWTRDAPEIDREEPDKVLAWIQQRVTCHTPDKDGSPELHRLVTRYQLHKCSSYCKRRKKCGKHAFITRCKFGFPRPVCENPKLNPVQDSLKSRTRIYKLARKIVEFYS